MRIIATVIAVIALTTSGIADDMVFGDGYKWTPAQPSVADRLWLIYGDHWPDSIPDRAEIMRPDSVEQPAGSHNTFTVDDDRLIETYCLSPYIGRGLVAVIVVIALIWIRRRREIDQI